MATPWHDSSKYSIGKAVRKAEFVNKKIVTHVPGPGSHEPSDVFTTKQKSSLNWSINRIDKNKLPKDIKHPGPQDYNIPSKIVESPEFGFGLRPFIDQQKCRTKTGPGDYNPRAIESSQTISIKGRSSMTLDRKQPGPGYYDDCRQQHYSNLAGSKIGRDKRKTFFIQDESLFLPGPGTYRNITFSNKK
mmetsp:Transcript_2803/g.4792  ORF Transcript_2803/g.4792 Transcript_2803/m.4792 type:complete len:189 (+) Transcript_2803:31-597(+)